ncbi:hypothetical protein NA78x_005525 [Anatilimnocola sp. NA78]|uniref:hypothetical protein n=1 Tax=Anatilimnocola sp. NA78 TaxID=3415683 RepID=UPI003CE556D8
MFSPIDRRTWLKKAAAFSLATVASVPISAQEAPKNDCPDCGGLGFLPLKNRRPYFHVEGQPAPKAADAVPHRFCPKCQANRNQQELVDEQTARLKTARDSHQKWEKETNLQLTRVETRHVVVHTQMPSPECVKMAQGFENLVGHLQNLTGSMELTCTRPESYEQMCFVGSEPYEHFRSVMEKLYSLEERGPSWSVGRGLVAFDHTLMAFFYETPQTMKLRPPVHGVCFMGGRKQLNVATNYRAPRWLSEGFAEYCEFAALKKNLWRSVYNQNEGPKPGDWVSQLRELFAANRLRPWVEQTIRQLEDWDARDYLQSFGMVAFLLQTEPKKFLRCTRQLKAGVVAEKALEEAYETSIAKLDTEFGRWLQAGGR